MLNAALPLSGAGGILSPTAVQGETAACQILRRWPPPRQPHQPDYRAAQA
ncbi:MAG: hypothetical protein U0401_28285 [Anaerolineae bacterium]